MLLPNLAYTMLFLIISAVSAMLGIHSIIKQNSSVTRFFLAVTICLCIWAFGFSIAVSAPNEQVCLFWRRVSAVGWSMIFAIVLHFSLIITEHKGLLARKWAALLLYIPALAALYIFSLSDELSKIQYRFVMIAGAWSNIAVNNGYDIFYYVYLLTYSLSTLVLFWRWWRYSSDQNTKKQARILFIAFGTAVFLGALTDLVNSSIRLVNIPQMAPVAFLIPIYATYYSIRQYRFMNVELAQDESILTDASQGRIIAFMGVAFIIGGVLYVVTQHFIERVANFTGFLISGLIFVFGCVVLFMQKIKVGTRAIETMFSATAIITIPAIAIHFQPYGGLTVWAFPFVFVILSVLFNSSVLLIASTVSVLLSQAMTWALAPRLSVIISSSDHLTRLVIFAICIWVASYANQTYIRRLKENVQKSRYQKLISDVSSLYASITEENKDETVDRLLSEICACFKADVSFLCMFDSSLRPADHYAYNAFRQESAAFLPQIPIQWSDRLLKEMTTNTVFYDCEAGGHNETLFPLMPLLSYHNARIFLSLPLGTKDSLGFMGIAKTNSKENWNDDQVGTLQIIANTITDSINKLAVEREITFMAYHDFLTKLPNRLMFGDRTERAIELVKRTGAQLGVIFLDLDSFKSVNDTLGHKIGDELIKAVAKTLKSTIRSYDTVCRFGGDEFLILLQSMNRRADVERVVNTVMDIFKQPFLLNGQEVFITASAGIAVYPYDGEDTDTLIKNADIAMYSAKEKGKNRYLFCSEDMKEDLQYKVQLTNLLYRALERKEMQVYYQPQVCLQTNRVIGAEALLRWFHPTMGAIPPCVFIPIAETTGIINSLGYWVLQQACAQMKQWQQMNLPRIRVAVNISVNQLRNPQFLDQVRGLLLQYELEPSCLELEVTESIAIKEPAYIITVLDSLKKLGVYVSIDDFGTEYSSLSRLKQLPVDRIKIDMQFVQGIDKNDKDRAISKIIISLAKSLGMKVIAEGVENSEQLDFLSQRLCDEVQGYVYYRPMPAEEFEAILAKIEPEDSMPSCLQEPIERLECTV